MRDDKAFAGLLVFIFNLFVAVSGLAGLCFIGWLIKEIIKI